MRRTVNRRSAIKFGFSALGAAAMPLPLGRRALAQGGDPHFFLHVCIGGAVDPTYWFDARPLDMTDAGVVANYLYKTADAPGDAEKGKRIPFDGANGTQSLRTTLVEPLMKYRQDFTVINGIVMNGQNIESHGQNMYTLFTGQNVGGFDSFVPMIGQSRACPIESIHIGGFLGDGNTAPKNFGGSVQIDDYDGAELFRDVAAAPGFDAADPAAKFVLERYAQRGQTQDAFALGCRIIEGSLKDSARLNAALKDAAETETQTENNGALLQALQMTHRLFSGRVTGAVTIMMARDMGMNFDIDAHDVEVCKALPTNYAAIIADLAALFEYLKTTEFEAGKSLLDVTTVLISSEMGRPYRQQGMPIWNTGTDHNQLINSFIVAGKAIKPGLLIGASDLETLETNKPENVSGAHKQVDTGYGGLACPMGKPFDFATGMARDDKPAEFKITDYLTVQSFTNTLLKLYGFGDDRMFRDPTGRQFPTIEKWLLKA